MATKPDTTVNTASTATRDPDAGTPGPSGTRAPYVPPVLERLGEWSALSAPSVAALEGLRAARTERPGDGGIRPLSLDVPTGGDGTTQLEPFSTGSFTDRDRLAGGVRYVWATFRMRNAQKDGTAYTAPRTNLTFPPIDTNDTFGATPVSQLRAFSGTTISDPTAATSFSASFSGTVSGADATTFVVHGSQSGTRFLGGTYTGNGSSTVTTPTGSFFPGEEVDVMLTLESGACMPHVAELRVGALGGNGTFAAAVAYGGGDAPQSVAAGDLDGNGDLDLSTANLSSDDIAVLLGQS